MTPQVPDDWMSVVGAWLLSIASFCFGVWLVGHTYKTLHWKGGQGLDVSTAAMIAWCAMTAGGLLATLGAAGERMERSRLEDRERNRPRCPHCRRPT